MNIIATAVVFTLCLISFGLGFSYYDLNKDKKLEYNEFEIVVLLSDGNKNKEITLEELIAATKLPKSSAEVVFKQYDGNGDGKVVKSEIENYFNKVDTNDDGSVSETEFNKAR